MIALPFFGIIFCIAESSFDYYVLSSLENASRQISRQIQVGNIQQQGLSANQFGAKLCGLMPSVLSCSNVVWNLQTVTNYYDVTTSATPTGGYPQYKLVQPSLTQSANKYCPGTSNQYVVLQLLYLAPAIASIWSPSTIVVGGQKARAFSTTNVFRNEAFTANSPSGC